MDVTARDLRELELTESFRGFNRDEVLDLLERAANTIEALEARVRQLTTAAAASPAAAPVADDGTGRGAEAAARTLALAQRVADETVADAKTEANGILERAQADSAQLIATAEREVLRIQEVERARLETEINDLERRRETLDRAVADLTRSEVDYRERLVGAIRAELTRIENSAVLAPVEAIATTTGESGQSGQPDAADLSATAAISAMPGDTAVGDSAGGDTAVGGTAVGDTAGGDTAAAATDPATTPLIGSALDPATPAPPAVAATIDLAEEQAAEQASNDDVRDAVSADLDDSDDFFASLREATSERTPLTAGEERLFDTDDERDSTFRDVFRRRR